MPKTQVILYLVCVSVATTNCTVTLLTLPVEVVSILCENVNQTIIVSLALGQATGERGNIACMCVCVCVCVQERERERERETDLMAVG